jgi:murein L,D-transpeptidase YafK
MKSRTKENISSHIQLPDQEGTLSQILKAGGINGTKIGLEIFVDKSTKTLSAFAGNVWLKSYHVELGDNGLGDKLVGGDHKTPEGTFYISELSVLKPVDEYLGSWLIGPELLNRIGAA